MADALADAGLPEGCDPSNPETCVPEGTDIDTGLPEGCDPNNPETFEICGFDMGDLNPEDFEIDLGLPEGCDLENPETCIPEGTEIDGLPEGCDPADLENCDWGVPDWEGEDWGEGDHSGGGIDLPFGLDMGTIEDLPFDTSACAELNPEEASACF